MAVVRLMARIQPMSRRNRIYGLAVLALVLTAVFAMTASQAVAIGGGEQGTLTAQPKSVKKGKKVTATATGCASGVDSEGTPYTASVDFLFVAPSRPVHVPRYTVIPDSSGKASYRKRLRQAGVWQLAAYCNRNFQDGGKGIAFEYNFVFVHVHDHHGSSGAGR